MKQNGMCCRLTGSALDHVFVDLGMSPLANSYPDEAALSHPEPLYPLKAYVPSESLLVQLPALVDPAEIFGDYAYFSSYSDIWLAHARDYVEMMCERFRFGQETHVVELASNDGYLLQYFLERGVRVTGVEPAANVAEVARGRGVPTLVEFFGTATARTMVVNGMTADLIVANNVLAHVPDLNDFVAGISILLASEGVVTIEFPHLARLISGSQFDTIYHEHFSYFTFFTATRALERHGLTVFDVEELPTHGGSLRVFATRAGAGGARSHQVSGAVERMHERERETGLHELDTYLSFAPRVEAVRRGLRTFLQTARAENKSVVGYGAPAKATTLLNYCEIGPDLLQYTTDRSPHKQGRYLPGVRIPIRPPEIIAETKPDYVLILPWNLKEEITEQMGFIRQWGGRFVVPIPVVEVLP